jgi:hypothetical protein
MNLLPALINLSYSTHEAQKPAVICNFVIMLSYQSHIEDINVIYLSYSTYKAKNSAVICNFVILPSLEMKISYSTYST